VKADQWLPVKTMIEDQQYIEALQQTVMTGYFRFYVRIGLLLCVFAVPHSGNGHYPPDIIPPDIIPHLGHNPPGCMYLSVSVKVESGIPNMWFPQTP